MSSLNFKTEKLKLFKNNSTWTFENLMIRSKPAVNDLFSTRVILEPYITYGCPNLKAVRDLVYKRGYVKVRPKL